MKHILVIDDDTKFRNLLVDYLLQHGYCATGIKDSRQLVDILKNEQVDLVVVDLNLGFEDGLEIVRTFSLKSDAPIIIISGDRIDETDKVLGLELGATDYICKPFGLQEFLAKVKVAMRVRWPVSTDRKDRRIYHFEGWTLNIRKRRLLSEAKNEIKLTAGEFNLLTAFLKSPKQILSRIQLLTASRVHDEEIFDRSIDVLILRLRRKLEKDPSRPRIIKTERGLGYFFDCDVTVVSNENK